VIRTREPFANSTSIAQGAGCPFGAGSAAIRTAAKSSLYLSAIATACGYPETRVVYDPTELARVLSAKSDRLIFVRAMIKPGASDDLPRPAISPADATRRIRGHIRSVAA